MSPEKWSFPTDIFLYTGIIEIIGLFHKASLVEVFFCFTEVLSMEIFQTTVSFQIGSSVFIDTAYLASSAFPGVSIEVLKMGCFLPEATMLFAVKFQWGIFLDLSWVIGVDCLVFKDIEFLVLVVWISLQLCKRLAILAFSYRLDRFLQHYQKQPANFWGGQLYNFPFFIYILTLIVW